MGTREFEHYDDHSKEHDLENCGACALLYAGEEGPNYAAWPLSFLVNNKPIPKKYFKALKEELKSENIAYVNNLKKHLIGTQYESFIHESYNEAKLRIMKKSDYFSEYIEDRICEMANSLKEDGGKLDVFELKELSEMINRYMLYEEYLKHLNNKIK